MFKAIFLSCFTNLKIHEINKKTFQIYEKKIKRFQNNYKKN